jgi:hypothetical protein
MTLSKRFYVRLSDVLAVRIICSTCKSWLSRQDKSSLSAHCSTCGARWLTEGSPDEKALQQLIWSLHVLRSLGEKSPFSVELEYEQPQ